jgi:DNA-directed RNA polymerase subunit RPC12/RpoP
MSRYRKKPIEVEAFLFGVDNMPDWFMDKITAKDVVLHHIPFDEARARNYGQMWCDIKTLEGTLQAYEGKDYIIKGITGEIYPCKADIFEATYEMPAADVVPKSEGEWVRQKGSPEAICSNCGRDVVYQVIDNKWAFENYCPHCGAKMKRGVE